MEEEIDISDLSLDEKIAILMRELPVPVQEFLQSPERNAISSQLAQKYRLHADTAGLFERAYIFMLLGISSPDQFVQELRNAGIDDTTVRGLASDVNELVFKKLREVERKEIPSVIPPAPQIPVMQVGERSEIPSNLPGQIPPAAPVTQPQVFPQAQPQTPTYPPPMPAQPQYAPQFVYAVPMPQQIYHQNPPIYSYIPAPQTVPQEYHQATRTMASDMELASHPAPAQAPVYQAPPASAPLPMESPQPPAYPPPSLASVGLTPIDRTHTNAPITKEFGSDPYREPIE